MFFIDFIRFSMNCYNPHTDDFGHEYVCNKFKPYEK